MIPEPIEKLLVQIAGKVYGGEENKKEVKKDPEKCLASLLLIINQRVTNATKMLDSTVEYAFYEDTLKEAHRFLLRHKARNANGNRKSKKVLATAA